MENLLLEVDQLIKDEKIIEAKDKLKEVIGLFPSFGKAHGKLGMLYMQYFEEYAKASKHLRLAMMLDTEYAASFENYGVLLKKNDQLLEAESVLLTALEKPMVNRYFVNTELAQVYESQMKFAKATKYYKKALLNTTKNDESDFVHNSIKRIRKKRTLMLLSFW